MPRLEGSPPIMEAMAMEPWVPSGHANLTSCLSGAAADGLLAPAWWAKSSKRRRFPADDLSIKPSAVSTESPDASPPFAFEGAVGAAGLVQRVELGGVLA
jgi:hypothetical protein